jgi:hypothetical protein
VQSSVGGKFTLDMTDIPPSPDEEFMPPIQSLLYKVGFYYSDAVDSRNFWLEEVKLWSKDVDQFAGPSKAIKDAVAGLIAPTDSDWTRRRSCTSQSRLSITLTSRGPRVRQS